MRFPPKFLLGATTAAHQVEGNNIHSDCWAQEHMKHTSYLEPSLDAVDHYNRCEEDIRLLAAAGLNTYRFSVEWARVEPEEGRFDDAEVEHYRKVIRCCKENGVAAEDDRLRVRFIRRALEGVEDCIAEGIPVKGYLHWTLLDNFEWQKAYSVKFGLIAVDRATQKRTVKPSLAYLGSQR